MVDLPPPEPPKAPEPEPAPEAPAADEPQEAQEAAEACDATCLGAEPSEDAENAIQASDAPAAQEPQEPQEAAGPDASDEPSAPQKRKRSAYTALEIVDQIHQVQEWLTEGKRPNQIRALCAEHWGLQTRASESRMADARRQMVIDVNAYERKDMAAKMLQSLEKVLEQSLASGMGSNAIGAMKLQADLLQLIARQN